MLDNLSVHSRSPCDSVATAKTTGRPSTLIHMSLTGEGGGRSEIERLTDCQTFTRGGVVPP